MSNTIAQPLRIGILGAARVATYALIAPAREESRVRLTAIAASDLERARDYAAAHGVERVVADYQALIDDPDIDLVYNALPPSRHADPSIAALRAGKHVLCEKPFALTATQARAMVDAARASDRQLIEAFHYRYHPLFAAVLDRLRSGAIGRIETIDAKFTVTLAETDGELRFSPALGGGALMDLGTYCVHWCRTVVGAEPVVAGANHIAARSGVDLHTRAELLFPTGVRATIDCGFDEGFAARPTIRGTAGTLDVHNPLAPQLGHQLVLERGVERLVETFDRRATYTYQLAAVVDVLGGSAAPLTGGDDAIAQMAALDAIRAALR